jgi:hypothetical protein
MAYSRGGPGGGKGAAALIVAAYARQRVHIVGSICHTMSRPGDGAQAMLARGPSTQLRSLSCYPHRTVDYAHADRCCARVRYKAGWLLRWRVLGSPRWCGRGSGSARKLGRDHGGVCGEVEDWRWSSGNRRRAWCERGLVYEGRMARRGQVRLES